MEATLSPLRNADGSCELKWGPQTRILCGVTGPGDISSSKRLFDRANLFFSINRIYQKSKEDLVGTVRPTLIALSSNQQSQQQQQSASSSSNGAIQPSDFFIHSIVEAAIDLGAYPRTGIQICTQELRADGPTDSAQLNGICLALLDSGIRMHYVFAAVTLAKINDEDKEEKDDDGEEFVQDPDGIMATTAKAIFTFVFRPSTYLGGKLIGTHSMGQFTMEEHKKALEIAERKCLPVFDFYRRLIQQKFIYQMKTTTTAS